jgi:hypothetical protein
LSGRLAAIDTTAEDSLNEWAERALQILIEFGLDPGENSGRCTSAADFPPETLAAAADLAAIARIVLGR